jgi:hypothetical protein
MKPLMIKFTMTLFMLGSILAAAPASAGTLILDVAGSGTVETNCLVTMTQGCTVTSAGEAMGTSLNQTAFSEGTFVLRLDTGSPISLNGYPSGPQGGTQQGICVPASFRGSLTAAGGDTIEFRHAGIVCEEAEPGSPYHYNGTYRIADGTGLFTGAVGAGSVTAVFTRAGAAVLLRIHGTIGY